MLRARVIASVWSTKKISSIPSGAFLEVEVEPGGARLVAFDVDGTLYRQRPLRLRMARDLVVPVVALSHDELPATAAAAFARLPGRLEAVRADILAPGLLGELLRAGDVGYELSMDPPTPIVVGVYPMRPIPRG